MTHSRRSLLQVCQFLAQVDYKSMKRHTEQAAIVERMEALMTTCRALEVEIEQSRTHAAHLLQVVLKAAFAPTQ